MTFYIMLENRSCEWVRLGAANNYDKAVTLAKKLAEENEGTIYVFLKTFQH